MGVEAARLALRSAPDGAALDALWFATASPAYLDKTNATDDPRRAAARHATSPRSTSAARCARASARCAPRSTAAARVLVVTSDMRDGLPTSADESQGGDGAAAVARRLRRPTARSSPSTSAAASATEEFIDRWRTPGDRRARRWEERFGETKYVPLGEQAWNAALKAAELSRRPGRPRSIVTGMHARAVRALIAAPRRRQGRSSSTTSRRRSATPAPRTRRCCSRTRSRRREPGQVIALVVLADGADVLCSARPTRSRRTGRRAPVATQVAQRRRRSPTASSCRGAAWSRSSRRAGPSPTASRRRSSGRTEDWKYAFVGSRDRDSGELHLPPARVSRVGDARRRHGRRRRWPTSQGTIAHVHDRPHRVLAEPADRVRGRRLRRRRPPARSSSPTSTPTR